MTDTPRTDAGRRMLSAIADHADLLRHDPANGLPLGLSYILAIEADAAGVRVGDVLEGVTCDADTDLGSCVLDTGHTGRHHSCDCQDAFDRGWAKGKAWSQHPDNPVRVGDDGLRKAARAYLDAEAEPAYSWVIESQEARREGRPNREVERMEKVARARVALEEALAALPAPDADRERLRALVKRTAGMGLCSQTHHEHLMLDARAALAALPAPTPNPYYDQPDAPPWLREDPSETDH